MKNKVLSSFYHHRVVRCLCYGDNRSRAWEPEKYERMRFEYRISLHAVRITATLTQALLNNTLPPLVAKSITGLLHDVVYLLPNFVKEPYLIVHWFYVVCLPGGAALARLTIFPLSFKGRGLGWRKTYDTGTFCARYLLGEHPTSRLKNRAK